MPPSIAVRARFTLLLESGTALRALLEGMARPKHAEDGWCFTWPLTGMIWHCSNAIAAVAHSKGIVPQNIKHPTEGSLVDCWPSRSR